MPDVYKYNLPKPLRIQIIHIWEDAIGRYRGPNNNVSGWSKLERAIAKEFGLFSLGNERNPYARCAGYFLNSEPLEKALDVIDISFQFIEEAGEEPGSIGWITFGITASPESAIEELNVRFQRAGVGYRFEEGIIFRIDSELVHSEVVKPALRYLNEPRFEGPRDEFLCAHAHYRAGEMKDAIVDANNAFESTLRTVCDQRAWPYPAGARASDLLKIVRGNGLWPDYLDKSFDQLVATLQSGLPEVRNKEAAHGQGAAPRETPDHVAGYALHLAAANILFIAEAHKAMK